MRLNVFMSHRASGGPLRRALGRMAPTLVASPLRRLVQALCLLLFLWLFFWVCWPYGEPDHAARMSRREILPAELFLLLDPLVGISATIAGRVWAWAAIPAAAIIALSVAWPRAFCGYMCPLGTVIDLFDAVCGRLRKRAAADAPPLPRSIRHLRYLALAAVLLAAAGGVMLAGYLSAIAVVTRGFQFILAPLQMGAINGWYLVPPLNEGHYISAALFAAVLLAGLLRPRFWCRHLCPTGAVFSLLAAAGLARRRVSGACIRCDRCRRICPFDAINDDYTTRTLDCTTCQTCGGVCPTGAIDFAAGAHAAPAPPRAASVGSAGPPAMLPSRRSVLLSAASGLALAGVVRAASRRPAVVRPPGSVPEELFLRLCVRCGLCYKACPNNVLQPVGAEHGPDMLWTPQAVFDWSGCDQTCANCGHVCPTGAIRPLPIGEKRAARMGLAIIDSHTCLPHAEREACQLCVDECRRAGYDAMEFRRVGVALSEQGDPIPDTGYLAPVVLADRCVGCGLCQNRCYLINVKDRRLLKRSAIVVRAGEDREDRIVRGSYRALRSAESARSAPATSAPATQEAYLPDFLQ